MYMYCVYIYIAIGPLPIPASRTFKFCTQQGPWKIALRMTRQDVAIDFSRNQHFLGC